MDLALGREPHVVGVLVRHHFETSWLRRPSPTPSAADLPERVERDFRGYLECGILVYGVARARCEDCGHERLISLLQGPGHLPFLHRPPHVRGRHLTDHVLAHVPGFRTSRALEIALYHALGHLPEPKLTHRFC